MLLVGGLDAFEVQWVVRQQGQLVLGRLVARTKACGVFELDR